MVKWTICNLQPEYLTPIGGFQSKFKFEVNWVGELGHNCLLSLNHYLDSHQKLQYQCQAVKKP